MVLVETSGSSVCWGKLHAEESLALIGWGVGRGLDELRFYMIMTSRAPGSLFGFGCLRRKQATQVVSAIFVSDGGSINYTRRIREVVRWWPQNFRVLLK